MWVQKQQGEPYMEQWTDSKLGEKCDMAIYCHPPIVLLCRGHHEKCQADDSQAGIKITGRNINNLRYADDTTLMAESKEELESLDVGERGE